MISPIQITPNMDMATLSAALTQNFQQIESENRTKIIRDESGVDRVIIGRYPDGQYGIKVSKPGEDVKDAASGDLYFNSNQNVFKVVKSDTVVMDDYDVFGGSSGQWTNWNAGGPTSVAHGLDFVPSVIAYVDFNGQYVLLPTTFQSITGTSGTGAAFERVFINVDDTNIYFGSTTLVNGVVSTPYTAGGYTLKYYLLQETAAD